MSSRYSDGRCDPKLMYASKPAVRAHSRSVDGFPSVRACEYCRSQALDATPEHPHSDPQSAIITFWEHLPESDPTASIFFTTSIPPVTEPKTTCLPSSQSVFT